MMRKNFITPKTIHSKSRCFIRGCKFEKFDRNDVERKSISTFRIPRKREVFEKWVQCCGRMELLDMPIESLRRTLSICELHFTTLSGTTVRKRIGNETVPTWFHEGHTPLSDEAMDSWRSTDHYKRYWLAFERRTVTVPANNSQRCPNLPPNSTAIYCQSTGPFPCLYCETVQPAQALDPDLRVLVPDLPPPTVPAIAPPVSSLTDQDKKPPLQKAVGKSLFNVVKNYFQKQATGTEESKSSQKVVVIKCAPTEKSEEESHMKGNSKIEDKKLIVVKISSPSSQNTEESPLQETSTDLIEVLSNCADLGAAEICEIDTSSNSKKTSKTVAPSKVVEKHKSPTEFKEDPKPKKRILYNFRFEKKLVPIPSSSQKRHNLMKSPADNSIVTLNSNPLETTNSEYYLLNGMKELKSVETTEDEIKRRKLV